MKLISMHLEMKQKQSAYHAAEFHAALAIKHKFMSSQLISLANHSMHLIECLQVWTVAFPFTFTQCGTFYIPYATLAWWSASNFACAGD